MVKKYYILYIRGHQLVRLLSEREPSKVFQQIKLNTEKTEKYCTRIDQIYGLSSLTLAF